MKPGSEVAERVNIKESEFVSGGGMGKDEKLSQYWQGNAKFLCWFKCPGRE